jgi:O-antigen/teichoic acid export membrane protein
VSASLLLLVPAYVLRADQEVSKANLIEAAGTVARVVAIVIAIQVDSGLLWLVVGAFFAPVVVSAVAGVRVFWTRELWPRPSAFRRAVLSPLLTVGIGFLGISFATLLVTSTDALVVAHLLGLAVVPVYSVAFALLVVMMGIQIAVADALWPAYAEAGSVSDVAWIRRVHRQATLALVAASAAFGIVLTLFGRPLIDAWAGPSAVPPFGLLVAFGVIAVLSAIEATHNRLLVALGRVRRVTLLLLGGALVNLPLSILLGSRFGVTGVAAGTVITYSFTAVMLVRSSRTAMASMTAGDAG